jgi:hypothetical protein
MKKIKKNKKNFCFLKIDFQKSQTKFSEKKKTHTLPD